MQDQERKKNIVLLTDCLKDLEGGAERQIFELSRGLDKKKYAVTIASLECEGRAPREIIESEGCHLVTFPVKRIYGLSGLLEGLRFYRFLKREKINILKTYHFSSDIWGVFWGRLAGIKIIISNRRDMGFWRKKRHVLAYRAVNRWVTKIIVNAASIKKMVMATESVSEDKIEIIYNGVDLTSSHAASSNTALKNKFGIKADDVVIMHVANLRPVKGHVYLIDAMASVIAQYPNTKLVLIGEDELNGQLHDQVDRLRIKDYVLFLGKRQDARQLLNIADICVLPSLSEGMSNSILEYMVAKKPIVATNVGGNPELIENGYNGILIDKENVDQLKGALISLIVDSVKRKTMGASGFKKVKEEFSMKSMIRKYDNIFSVTLSKSGTILHLVSSGGMFGAERVILNIADHSHDRFSFVGAIANRHNPHLEVIDEARKSGLETAVFDSYGRYDFGTVFRVRKFIKENNVSIVHTHNYKSDIVGFLSTLFSKTKWIATNHVWHGLDRKLRVYERIDAFILRFATQVIAVSNEIKKDLLAKNIPEQKVCVIDNGIDICQFNRSRSTGIVREELGIQKNDIVVTIVGRLSPEKGHKTFLKAAKDVSIQKNNVKFLIVGGGPIEEELHAEASRLELNGYVVFAGIRKDMPAIYAISDFLVNASSIEGLPMTILEAMAAKIALIVTPVGAISEVIKHEVNGLIVDTGDYKGLSEGICSLVDNPSKRENLIECAYRDVCDRFSSKVMATRYGKIYESIA